MTGITWKEANSCKHSLNILFSQSPFKRACAEANEVGRTLTPHMQTTSWWIGFGFLWARIVDYSASLGGLASRSRHCSSRLVGCLAWFFLGGLYVGSRLFGVEGVADSQCRLNFDRVEVGEDPTGDEAARKSQAVEVCFPHQGLIRLFVTSS